MFSVAKENPLEYLEALEAYAKKKLDGISLHKDR